MQNDLKTDQSSKNQALGIFEKPSSNFKDLRCVFRMLNY